MAIKSSMFLLLLIAVTSHLFNSTTSAFIMELETRQHSRVGWEDYIMGLKQKLCVKFQICTQCNQLQTVLALMIQIYCSICQLTSNSVQYLTEGIADILLPINRAFQTLYLQGTLSTPIQITCMSATQTPCRQEAALDHLSIGPSSSVLLTLIFL